jgi:N,N'-diacetyllegionaminate synthase
MAAHEIDLTRKCLIAEVGNNHFGSLDTAKEMIRVAKESGADLVKFQAFKASSISGSMPLSFYSQCEFTFNQYAELLVEGVRLGIPVFFSIFHDELNILKKGQKYHKVSGSQSAKGMLPDEENTFVSLQDGHLFNAAKFTKSIPLYVCEYQPEDPRLDSLLYLSKLAHRRPYGYSDHYVGSLAAEIAVKTFGCTVIEKHFTLEKNIPYQGRVFRDTVHGATPNELEAIAKVMGG